MSFTLGTTPPPAECRLHPETSVWVEPLAALQSGNATFIDLGKQDDPSRDKVRRKIRQAADAMGLEVRFYRDARAHIIVVLRAADEPQDADQLTLAEAGT